MLSVGNTIPGSGLAETMIMTYREIIAADYAHTFMEQYLRVGMSAIEKGWLLNVPQREDAAQIRARAVQIEGQLAQEKAVLYSKRVSVTSVASYLEQLERQLRSSMPQSV